jgi:hypothetical protein
VTPQSTTGASSSDGVKSLAIRLPEAQHAQLAVIAQLEELTLTDAIRQAIELWIDQRRAQPDLQARAQAVLDDIERDAANRRGAIASLITERPTTSASGRDSGRRPRGGEAPAKG